MKILKYFTTLLPMICFSLGLVSCSNSENDLSYGEINYTSIKLSTDHVSLYEEDGQTSQTVQIKSGEGIFSVKSENENIAKATIKDKTITINIGSKSGATTVIVSGENNQRGEITINSGIYGLTVDKNSLNMKPGEKTTVKILSGNFNYAGKELKVEAINDAGDVSTHFDTKTDVLWPDPERTSMVIKALKAGKATIKITDTKGKTCEIALNVLDIELNNLALSKSVVNLYGIGNDDVDIVNGNADYLWTVGDKSVVNVVNTGTEAKPHFSLKAQKVGSTTLTVTDNLTGQVKTVLINVLAYSGVGAQLPSDKWLSIDFKSYATSYPDKVDNWSKIPEFTWEINARYNAGNSGSTLMGIEGQILARAPFNTNNKYISMSIGDHPIVWVPTELSNNKWYRFVFVVSYTNKTVDIYINGEKQSTQKTGGDTFPNGGMNLTNLNGNENNLFGIGRACGGRYMNGAIRYVRMWTRCLSDKEVKDFDNQSYVDPSAANLLCEWVFEGDTGASSFSALNEPYFKTFVQGGDGGIDAYETPSF